MNQNDLTVTNKNINAWWVKIISNTYAYIAFFMVIYVWLYVMISSNYITILWNVLYLCDPIYQDVWPYNHIRTFDHIYIYICIYIYYVSCHPIFLTKSYMGWSTVQPLSTLIHTFQFFETSWEQPILVWWCSKNQIELSWIHIVWDHLRRRPS